MSVYSVDKLMVETRRLAAEYYRATQQVLPVGSELAKYDAVRLLSLKEPDEVIKGVDAFDLQETSIQIKSRVIFNEEKRNYRIGQLNFDGEWQTTLLILMNADYQPVEMYLISRDELSNTQDDKQSPKQQKRGAMSVAKFKAIGQLIWTQENGVEAGFSQFQNPTSSH